MDMEHHDGKVARFEKRSNGELTLDVEVIYESPGMIQWAVWLSERRAPSFLAILLGATRTKMEKMHGRQLDHDDLNVGVRRAVLRAREQLEAPENAVEGAEEVRVMVRDSDLAELRGRVVGPVAGVPP